MQKSFRLTERVNRHASRFQKNCVLKIQNYDRLQLHFKQKGGPNSQNGRFKIRRISCFVVIIIFFFSRRYSLAYYICYLKFEMK